MIEFPPAVHPRASNLPPRCKGCAYILENLEVPRCPECGRAFDPREPNSYTRQPGFVFWRYWLPGVAGAAAVGFMLSLIFIAVGRLGWGLTLATPITIGMLLGYGISIRKRVIIALTLPCLAGVIVGLYVGQELGPFCALIMTILFLIPIWLGVLFGSILREVTRWSAFDQRWYLPLLLFLLLPFLADRAERMFGGRVRPETLFTTAVLPVSVDAAYHSHVFTEDSEPPPRAAYRAGLTRPSSTAGSTALGGNFAIHFTRGSLNVLITRRVEDSLFAYRFVGQTDIEDRAIRLLDGQMDFEPLGPQQTRVTVATRYQPLVTPRWYWRPFEQWAGTTTHRYLLDAMTMDVRHQSVPR